MSAEMELIDAMRDEPDSVEHGLVYADWLEDQGDPRAELIRIQMALRCPVDSADCPPLRARERILTKQLRAQIIGPVRSLTKRVDFHHGLIVPEVSGDVFLKNAAAIVNQAPTFGVRFTGLRTAKLPDCEVLQQLRAISLTGNARQADRAALLKSRFLTELRAINPGEAGRRTEFMEAWCRDKWPRLTRAVLQASARIDISEILRASATKRLKHLELGFLEGDSIEKAFRALSDNETAPALETFCIRQQSVRDTAWSRFCERVSLPSVQRMNLSDDFSSPKDLRSLLANENLPRLEELAVLINTPSFKPETFDVEPPPNLRRLALRQCRFTKESAIAFAESPLFGQLESLRIAPGNLSRFLRRCTRPVRLPNDCVSSNARTPLQSPRMSR